MRKKILIIGSLNTDLVVSVREMPQIGETIMGDGLRYVQGGKGANQAFAAGKLGGDVVMLGCVGGDDFGRMQRDNLAGAGVNVSQLKTSGDKPTGTAVICVDKNGDNTIVVIQGANGDCDKAYLEEHDDVLRESDVVVLQMEIPFEALAYAVRRARELGKTVILNPAPVSGPLPDDLLAQLDYITPNETELAKLTGLEGPAAGEPVEAARRLLEKGVRNVLVTLGEQGALHVQAEGARIYPVRKVLAVDTTAAGDCFNGALAVALADGKGIEEAVGFANLASSIAVTRSGAQTSIPDIKELKAILANKEREEIV